MTEPTDHIEARLLAMIDTLAPAVSPEVAMARTSPRARPRLIRLEPSRRPPRLSVVGTVVIVLLAVAFFATEGPNVLGVKTGAQNRAAQSDLTNAITSGKTTYTDHRSYGSTAAAVVALRQSEPELQFTAGPVTYDHNSHLVSVRVSADGQILVVAGQSAMGSCWYAEDNEEATATNDGLAPATPTPGISYASSDGAREPSCSVASPPKNWSHTYPDS